jgi:hypothetical protein
MTDVQRIAAISVNLLRIAEWYYKDPAQNVAICQRYLEQSRALRAQVHAVEAEHYLRQLDRLSLPSPDTSIAHAAERFLTLGVLLQHPEHWMK